MTDILLISPPFTQLNTPYPASPVLCSFLRSNGYIVSQYDLGIETINKIFTTEGLTEIFEYAKIKNDLLVNDSEIYQNKNEYIKHIEAALEFLKGNNDLFAQHICNGCLPKSPNSALQPYSKKFIEQLSETDRANYLATLYIEEIGGFITDYVDPNFGFSRYAEQLAIGATSFDPILQAVNSDTYITDVMLKDLNALVESQKPLIVGITVPFHGNLIGALKIGKHLKTHFKHIKIIMGGGYFNTELREVTEQRLFNYTHYICLDDGERPLLNLLDYLLKEGSKQNLVRTFAYEEGRITFYNNPTLPDFTHEQTGLPDYAGLNLKQYFSILEIANPMHRLWTDGRWNKMALAHGCYWAKCSFCDTSLDYIKRYSAASASTLCNRIETVIAQTQCSKFHFVDEAAPPKVLRNFAIELLKRNIKISWWANIRFEKAFTPDLCALLAKAGCIAVSGGLEVASDRLLLLMNKGVTLEQVAQVTHNFSKQGIMVHAYLMFGFPTETEQETIDSLEIVRQLFKNQLIQSGFWHRFVMTFHSEIGQNTAKFNVSLKPDYNTSFARNDAPHNDPSGCNHSKFSEPLRKAIFNYMHNQCIDLPLSTWFTFKTPNTSISPTFILDAINSTIPTFNEHASAIWLGAVPKLIEGSNGMASLHFQTMNNKSEITLPTKIAHWAYNLITNAQLNNQKQPLLKDIISSYNKLEIDDFDYFVTSRQWARLKSLGLIFV